MGLYVLYEVLKQCTPIINVQAKTSNAFKELGDKL